MAITLVLNPATVVAGQTFTATASGAAAGEPVTFQYDAAPNQVINADLTGVAVATFTATTTGPVVASGTINGTAVQTVTVTAAQGCVITVTPSPANPTTGQPVTLTTTVTCNGAPVDGAVVQLTTPNGIFVGITAGGVGAALNIGPLPLGISPITATVVGFTGLPPTCLCIGNTITTTVTVTAAATCAVTLTSSPASPTVGQPVTLTATVLCDGAPVVGATVNFAGPGGLAATATTDASGVATTTTSTLPAGANAVTATVNAVGGTCTCTNVVATTTVNVAAAGACAVALTAAPANPTAGQSVTLTAAVTCSGAPVVGATVLFSSGTTPLGTTTTTATGQAVVTTTVLPAGTNTVTATVIGEGSTCACTGVAGTTTVTVGPSQTFAAHPACYTLNFPPLPWSFAHATLTVTGATPGSTVTFHSDGAGGPVLCTAVADSFGNASCVATLSIFQLLSGYTATTPVPGGFLTSSSTLLPCL
ncbi:Ig-like domain-containing protein [Streptomyces sioyaensis]|uniref:Ig-like domain-containing protein n=1 Tax=Streptomyces sioyaensis TaxID=67364 RepID=UPI0033D06492